jgi:undecaprenyl diphosphate synthase
VCSAEWFNPLRRNPRGFSAEGGSASGGSPGMNAVDSIFASGRKPRTFSPGRLHFFAKMKIPNHIAIIMDGNGRWAEERRLPRIAGHKEGVKRVKEIVREAKKIGVKILTIFAFSTENWIRPKKEITLLFSYLKEFLKTYRRELVKEGIKLNVIGRRDRIDKRIIKNIEAVEKETKKNDSFIFNIALDYGGRWDIVWAVNKVLLDYKNGKLSQEDIDEDSFAKYLSLAGIEDPQLLIRTSGEQRISNFLLWNLAYCEFYFPKTCWPDFTPEELVKAINIYSERDRRFGAIDG